MPTMLPKLRHLDINFTMHQRRPSLVVQDPLQLSDRYLILPRALGAALMLCDGRHEAGDMAAILVRDYGLRIEQAVVDDLLLALDEALFLENERSAQALEAAIRSFRSLPARPATIAGAGYPADAEALRLQFDRYLEEVGPVAPLPAGGRALISPHIDYQRGHKVYARVWKQAAAMAQAAELVVILGTDHYGGFNPVTLTRQSYATPYGVLPTELGIVDALATALDPARAFAGELYHRREHAIELVAVWLHHMRQGQAVPVVPILVGSFQPLLAGEGSSPDQDPAFAVLLRELAHLTTGRRTLYVASGDLAHIGPAFGGEPVGIVERADLATHDEELIGHLCAGDAEGFWRFIQRTEDRNNVCGVSPFYLTLKLLGPVEGQRAGYAVCPADDHNTSVVSVCGVLFG